MSFCPHCENRFTHVEIEAVQVTHVSAPQRLGVSYNCPHCKKCLSVSIDPVAIRTEIVAQVTEAIRMQSTRRSGYDNR